MAGFGAFPLSSQKLPFAGEECILFCTYTSHWSFHTTSVMSQFVLCLTSPCFIFSAFLLKSSGIPLQFGLTVPQRFIFCSVKSSGEEKLLPIYNLWPRLSALIIYFTVACVAVVFIVTRFLSFTKYTSMPNV